MFINIFDPITNKMILKNLINELFKSSTFAWVNVETFVTISWNKTGIKMFKNVEIAGY